MPLSHYDYHLPTELIAQEPLPNRSDARLLVVDRSTQSFEHRHIRDLPEFLQPQDCLVLNDTKVIPARLVGKRLLTGGRWEGLFLQPAEPNHWQIIGKTRGKIQAGETVRLHSHDGKNVLHIDFTVRQEDNTWLVKPLFAQRHKDTKGDDSLSAFVPSCETKNRDTFTLLSQIGLSQIGWTPIPPYIRGGKPQAYDQERYQTVYAAHAGSVAAPTAGLHLTPELLETVKRQGTTITSVTLHVGVGTFKPITAESIEEHYMHSEWCSLSADTAETLRQCRSNDGRIVAVGTTSVRTLESASDSLVPLEGATSLFIRPPYRFRNVDVLLTNFHFPKSTLLILVRTFGGDELIREAYQEAIRKEYRFFSYGDAMLIR
ncbi:MAG: tRNA preQ1(34) S-adenosylmethionine ribosyltransferase-isomerase QueA [Planctomycetaceae bacterium]|nr:tRNA preQ1(34) S-adenosylmethionine ribosyltransferase-isomerase QueA [Planctomycetaceae bacterium]